MLDETMQLEKLRQQIEKVEEEAGSASDFLDYGKPNEAQAKSAKKVIENSKREVERLRSQLGELIAKSPPQAVQEWANFHTAILQKIASEQVTNPHTKTRVFVAKQTLEEWEKVRRGEQEYVRINWHFLKDYKDEAKKLTGGEKWKFWK
ncbi:MAG: hypothetical protein C4557_06850 [Anaerolineaceae bacterium]|jgi:hypothetical protein|nr:MAG: hypothetical protein C4557_06850 [Anaerolineaceae bacterium]